MFRPQARHRGRDVAAPEAEGCRDPQMSGHRSRRARQHVADAIELGEDAGAAFGQKPAFRGELQAAAGAVEQTHADTPLERGQALCDRRRADIERAGSGGQRYGAADHLEEFQIVGVQH